MDDRYNRYRGMILSLLLLVGLLMTYDVDAQADILDSLCQADANTPQVMTSLIEEAEATGMPSSTLNRLLIRGYHDRDSIKHLSRLLCVIVRSEEAGLPPGPLFRKLDEGLGKRVSLERIIEVVEAKVADMEFVQSLISNGDLPVLEDDNVPRLSDTLSAGLTRPDLEEIFDRDYEVPVKMRVVAAEIKGYGRAIGFGEAMLDSVVFTGLASAALSDDWSYFVKLIAEARRKKIADRTISLHAVKILSENGSLDDLAVALGF